MGAIQILLRDNPLAKPGLTLPQRLLFWESTAHYLMAGPSIMMALCPLIFLVAQVSPIQLAYMWELSVAFAVFFTCNRLMVSTCHPAMLLADPASLSSCMHGCSLLAPALP